MYLRCISAQVVELETLVRTFKGPGLTLLWFASAPDSAAGRAAAAVGLGVAVRGAWRFALAHGKAVAQRCGERILDIRPSRNAPSPEDPIPDVD